MGRWGRKFRSIRTATLRSTRGASAIRSVTSIDRYWLRVRACPSARRSTTCVVTMPVSERSRAEFIMPQPVAVATVGVIAVHARREIRTGLLPAARSRGNRTLRVRTLVRQMNTSFT